jgi:hypothetical protein
MIIEAVLTSIPDPWFLAGCTVCAFCQAKHDSDKIVQEHPSDKKYAWSKQNQA